MPLRLNLLAEAQAEEELRRRDPVKRGIKPEAFGQMYSGRNHPEAKGDLRAVLLKCRRPDLYKPRQQSGK